MADVYGTPGDMLRVGNASHSPVILGTASPRSIKQATPHMLAKHKTKIDKLRKNGKAAATFAHKRLFSRKTVIHSFLHG